MKFQSGDVIYWVGRRRHSPYEYYVNYGIVDEEFSDAVCVDRLHIRDNRYINDIPYKEFPSVTKWQKLPKGWTYNTELFEMEWRNNDWAVLNTLRIDNPEDIKKALELGILVYLKDYDQTVPHSEVSNKLGWRIRKEHDNSTYIYPHVTLQKDNAFKTYEEAKAVIDAQEAEWKRQSELTDEEWSIEQIDHDLQRWAKIYSKSPEEVQKVRDFLLGMDKIEDIETRVFDGDFQWKYWKNKKWRTVVLD
jgi:hypothetical protein